MDDRDVWLKLSGDLIRFATALVGPDEAEDVVSRVMVRLLSRRSLASLDNPEAYMFRAVLNEGRSVWRRARRPILVRADRMEALPDPVPELIEAMRRLPARERAAVYFVYYLDWTLGDAADAMGCAEGTVKRYLHDARRRLRANDRLRNWSES